MNQTRLTQIVGCNSTACIPKQCSVWLYPTKILIPLPAQGWGFLKFMTMHDVVKLLQSIWQQTALCFLGASLAYCVHNSCLEVRQIYQGCLLSGKLSLSRPALCWLLHALLLDALFAQVWQAKCAVIFYSLLNSVQCSMCWVCCMLYCMMHCLHRYDKPNAQ